MMSSLMFDWRSSSAIAAGGRVDVERDVMRLAVLGDAVSEAAEAPGLGLGDLPAIVFDDLGGVFRERIDLGLCKVLAREENMLVERHVSRLSLGRSLTSPSAAPLRLSFKNYRRSGRAVRQRRAYGGSAPENASRAMNLSAFSAQTDELQQRWEPQRPLQPF